MNDLMARLRKELDIYLRDSCTAPGTFARQLGIETACIYKFLKGRRGLSGEHALRVFLAMAIEGYAVSMIDDA